MMPASMHGQTYELFCIALPPTEVEVANYRDLRLLALQAGPPAFGSTYERESAFSHAQWRARLDSQDRYTLVARAAPQEPVSVDNLDQFKNWVGTASILSPEMLRHAQSSLPEEIVKRDLATFALVGMWVHPEHRRKGLGGRLVRAGLAAVQADSSQGKEKLLMLEVHDNNEGARMLYASLGFFET